MCQQFWIQQSILVGSGQIIQYLHRWCFRHSKFLFGWWWQISLITIGSNGNESNLIKWIELIIMVFADHQFNEIAAYLLNCHCFQFPSLPIRLLVGVECEETNLLKLHVLQICATIVASHIDFDSGSNSLFMG